jgi:RNA polymerase sigma-70 factor, ECF subfamily
MEADAQLLDRARMLDKAALGKIFDLYSSPLYCYALRLCGDPALADHVVADVFAKLLDQFSSGKGPSANLRSYLYEIAYHRIIDEQRSSRRRVPLETVEWIRQDRNAAYTSLEDLLLFKQILHAMRHALSNDQRHVVILRFLEGFSLRETATITGKNVQNVKVIQSRAIVALRKALGNNRLKRAAPSSDADK